MQLTIIIPAHNEEQRLPKMLDEYLPFFARAYGADFEVLVVINGSSDQTAVIAGKYAEKFAQLKYVVETRPIGKGGAIMLGIARAKGDLVGFTDADGSTPPAAFQKLVERIGRADAIIASRWIRGAQVRPRQPWKRRMASRLFNGMVRLLFGLRFSDTQCGAKLMKRGAALRILPELGITRWAFDVDLLFQLRRAGFQTVEIPSVWHDVAGSRLKIIRASLEMFAALARLRLLYSPFKNIVAFYDRYFARFFNA
ncbi:MAG: glycosyltransferase family 2 protein [Kiritimatiellae bacterium]|nr:glycosyltransferase family 2 protein [Kiritimatiellia bacterium]